VDHDRKVGTVARRRTAARNVATVGRWRTADHARKVNLLARVGRQRTADRKVAMVVRRRTADRAAMPVLGYASGPEIARLQARPSPGIARLRASRGPEIATLHGSPEIARVRGLAPTINEIVATDHRTGTDRPKVVATDHRTGTDHPGIIETDHLTGTDRPMVDGRRAAQLRHATIVHPIARLAPTDPRAPRRRRVHAIRRAGTVAARSAAGRTAASPSNVQRR
jgi:hypothetical protein